MKTDQYQIILMNYDKKLKLYSDIINAQLIVTDFRTIIMSEFNKDVVLNGEHLTIKSETYKAYCGTKTINKENIEIDIYGTDGMIAFKKLSNKMDWQIFNKQTNKFI